MNSYEHKRNVVLRELWNRKEESISLFEIQADLKNEFSDLEVEAVLQYLFEKGIVLVDSARDVSGAEIPILVYRLSLDGLILLEDSLPQMNKEQLKIIPIGNSDAMHKDKEDIDKAMESLAQAIDKSLEPFKSEFQVDANCSFAKLVLQKYFEGLPCEIAKPIFVRHGVKMKLAKALGDLYVSNKNKAIDFEYLAFMKKTFSIFKNEELSPESFFDSNLYKYCRHKQQ